LSVANGHTLFRLADDAAEAHASQIAFLGIPKKHAFVRGLDIGYNRCLERYLRIFAL
jgi:hypothetical protein